MNRAKRLTLGRDENGRRLPTATREWRGRCALSYDLAPDRPDPAEGDVLRTEAGSSYLILGARRVRSSVHPRRFALDCERISREQADKALTDGARLFPMRWYGRG